MAAGILVVRLGAMGDIIHALPAVAALRAQFPSTPLTWVVESRWTALLEANPNITRLVPLVRGTSRGILDSLRRLRMHRYETALDFQGLLKSAIVAKLSGAKRIVGFAREECREALASFFYSLRIRTSSLHVVDKNLELASALGARRPVEEFSLPPGKPEGQLPAGPFVLCCPLAGWKAKQWPLERYRDLARRLFADWKMPLVLNGPPAAAPVLSRVPEALLHLSSLEGLLYATRKAHAVVGVDSGPLHLAAALGKPGVAIYGPTDPARNGPYGGSITVLRAPDAATSYKRRDEYHPAMLAIGVDAVIDAMRERLARCESTPPACE